MTGLKILIVDDEALARGRLHSMLEEINAEHTIAEAKNGHQALDMVQNENYDLLLLDIRMPGIDGIETANHISQLDQRPCIIFTTAFSDYALDAFDSHAIDYLLKPIRKERLGLALQKAISIHQPTLVKLQQDLHTSRSHISALVQGNLQLIPINQIQYFKADNKYVSVFFQQQEILIEESLRSLEEEFHSDFIRIHRNTLVAKNAIETLEKDPKGGWNLKLIGYEERFPVSRRLQSVVRKFIRSGEIQEA